MVVFPAPLGPATTNKRGREAGPIVIEICRFAVPVCSHGQKWTLPSAAPRPRRPPMRDAAPQGLSLPASRARVPRLSAQCRGPSDLETGCACLVKQDSTAGTASSVEAPPTLFRAMVLQTLTRCPALLPPGGPLRGSGRHAASGARICSESSWYIGRIAPAQRERNPGKTGFFAFVFWPLRQGGLITSWA